MRFDEHGYYIPEDPTAEPARSSTWHTPIDLTNVMDPEEPDLCDVGGGGIFYRGRVNMIIGESESGKSWVAVATINQAIKAGGTAVWFDFDSTPSEVAGRFACTGGIPTQLTYYRIEDQLGHIDDELLIGRLKGTAVVVIDGMSDHYGLQDINDYKGTEVTSIMRRWQRIATATNAGILMIDHISRSAVESGAKGASGSQAKRAKVTGTSILVKCTRPMGRGLSGWADLIIDKDRGGHLRPRAADGRKIASFNLDATEPDNTQTVFRVHDREDAQRGAKYRADSIDQAIVDALEATPGLGRADLQVVVRRRKEDVFAAIGRLTAGGVIVNKGTPVRPHYETVTTVPEFPNGSGNSGTAVPGFRGLRSTPDPGTPEVPDDL
ncbi:MAG: helicase RepA family protein [Actinomycetota bacterium]|nr:helicase RepA family protein [Actinomycetota bacterium]